MSSFSDLQVDQLFNTTDTNKQVYYTDMIYGYRNLDRFNDLVKLESYLQPVKDLQVYRYKKSVIDDLIEGNKISDSITANIESKDTMWSGDRDTLVFSYDKLPFDKDTAERIYNDLINSLGDPTTVNGKQDLALIPTNHRKASVFMENIILSMCNWKFANVKSELLMALKNSTDMVTDVQNAGVELSMIVGPTEASIISSLHSTCSDVITTLVANQASSTYALDGFIEGSSFMNNRYRATLREAMYPKLILRQYAGNTSVKDQVLMYLRRLLIELYIVSYYPYIHYLYINALYEKFKKNGDFVNMRVAALIRVAFTINALMTYTKVASEKFDPKTLEDKQSVLFRQWAQTLKNYMAALSRADFSDKDFSIKNVLSNLHDLSSKVVTQSMSIDELKESIQFSQVQVRSIIARLKQVNRERSKIIGEYSALLFFMFLIIIVSAVLIVFNFYKTYLMYGLIGICSGVILYSIVKTILSITKK